MYWSMGRYCLDDGFFVCLFYLLHAGFFKGGAILVSENMFGSGQIRRPFGCFSGILSRFVHVQPYAYARGQVQVLMHICVRLHICACGRAYWGLGVGEVCTHLVLLVCLAWRPFCLLPLRFFFFFWYNDFPGLYALHVYVQVRVHVHVHGQVWIPVFVLVRARVACVFRINMTAILPFAN